MEERCCRHLAMVFSSVILAAAFLVSSSICYCFGDKFDGNLNSITAIFFLVLWLLETIKYRKDMEKSSDWVMTGIEGARTKNYCPVCGAEIKELEDGTIQTCSHIGTQAGGD